jgi:hypothetical protein
VTQMARSPSLQVVQACLKANGFCGARHYTGGPLTVTDAINSHRFPHGNIILSINGQDTELMTDQEFIEVMTKPLVASYIVNYG